jgi:hypothetical protein
LSTHDPAFVTRCEASRVTTLSFYISLFKSTVCLLGVHAPPSLARAATAHAPIIASKFLHLCFTFFFYIDFSFYRKKKLH